MSAAAAPMLDEAGRIGAVQPSARETLLVYRHRLAPLSEVGFLSRFYLGFERLNPVWLGQHLDAGAAALPGEKLQLGRSGALGKVDRVLFRHFGIVPRFPDLRALRPRLVHAHFGRGGALALPLARALGIPLVVTFHGADATKETHYRRRLLPRVYARRLADLQGEAALFVCVSDFVRDRLLARGFPPEKLEVIRQGVEIDADDGASRAPPEYPYILFVGRFVEKKGATHLIEAMRLLGERGNAAELVLIGDGPLGAALRQQARGLPRVSFRGWLPNAEVRRCMRGATVMCVPSVAASDGDSEGLPTVIFEAMAEGLPVVGSRHAGIPEAVQHGRTGLLVPPGDPAALADALESLIARPEKRQRLGAAARTVAAERFGVVEQSRRLEAALLRVSSEARRCG
ncbi:MAG TPA: glycosyltransferase [Stellaceae bacterium]|jgi:glycosyltransferase involved in cell wall biosynthesis|nr:glycosyltransferase [Stellaceae bacterium]